MSFLQQLQWRNATKDFDPEKDLAEEKREKILEAIQYAPSSYGLQPYHITVISDQELKEKLKEKGYDQAQITDCSHLFVFSGRTDVLERIDKYMETSSGGDPEKREKMKNLEAMMKGSFQTKSDEEKQNWANRQAYIALGFGLAACAELSVDACPMEGFEPGGFKEVLELPNHITPVVLMATGYRKAEPRHPKVRFPQDELFSHR